MKNWIVSVLLCVILTSGLLLRSYHSAVWPREGATFDEFAWTFLGMSTWKTGIPTSWSPHKAYTEKQEYYNPKGAHFTLVTPYLEHPPLFGLLAGGFARMRGIEKFDDVTIGKIRPLAIVLGVLSIVSVFLLSNAVYGVFVGLLASGLYAITPSVVIGSRLVQNENFFIPFFLLSIYLAYEYIQKNKSIFFYVSACISGILPLAKIPWIAAPIAVIGMLLYAKKRKEAIIVGGMTFLYLSLFLLWGYALDSSVFINLWKLQLARYDMSFAGFFVLFRDPIIVDRLFIDGWIYFGWGSLLLLFTRDFKKNMPILVGFLAYAIIYLFAIPAEPLHGWYRYPFYPFLLISTAVILQEYWHSNLFVYGIWSILTGLSMLGASFERQLGFSYIIYRTYILLVFASISPRIFSGLNRFKGLEYLRYIITILICVFTVYGIVYYSEQ